MYGVRIDGQMAKEDAKGSLRASIETELKAKYIIDKATIEGAVATLKEKVKSIEEKDTVPQASRRPCEQQLKEKSSQWETASDKLESLENFLNKMQKEPDDKNDALKTPGNDLNREWF